MLDATKATGEVMGFTRNLSADDRLIAKSAFYNEDCIAGMAERVPADGIDLVVTSIPFE